MCDQFREPLSLLPRCSEPGIWITKPIESSVKKFVRRRSLPAAALSVKGPAENQLRRTIIFSSHPSEPMVDERRLPDAGPCNDGHDIYIPVRPRCVEESDILLSTKDVAPRKWQSCYGNF